jgi:hypothetical protein
LSVLPATPHTPPEPPFIRCSPPHPGCMCTVFGFSNNIVSLVQDPVASPA